MEKQIFNVVVGASVIIIAIFVVLAYYNGWG
jgi:hypothetical protein